MVPFSLAQPVFLKIHLSPGVARGHNAPCSPSNSVQVVLPPPTKSRQGGQSEQTPFPLGGCARLFEQDMWWGWWDGGIDGMPVLASAPHASPACSSLIVPCDHSDAFCPQGCVSCKREHTNVANCASLAILACTSPFRSARSRKALKTFYIGAFRSSLPPLRISYERLRMEGQKQDSSRGMERQSHRLRRE